MAKKNFSKARKPQAITALPWPTLLSFRFADIVGYGIVHVNFFTSASPARLQCAKSANGSVQLPRPGADNTPTCRDAASCRCALHRAGHPRTIYDHRTALYRSGTAHAASLIYSLEAVRHSWIEAGVRQRRRRIGHESRAGSSCSVVRGPRAQAERGCPFRSGAPFRCHRQGFVDHACRSSRRVND